MVRLGWAGEVWFGMAGYGMVGLGWAGAVGWGEAGVVR